jgi:hypothetical protein
MERTDACAGSLHFLQINVLKLSENRRKWKYLRNSNILSLVGRKYSIELDIFSLVYSDI